MKQDFLLRFSKPEKPQHVIRKATDKTLDPKDLLASSGRLNYQYIQAGFNDEAKFRIFFRVAVMKRRPLATFAMNRGVGTYRELKKAIMDFENGSRSFSSAGSEAQVVPNKWLEKQKAKDAKLLARLDACVLQMETKVDAVVDQLSSLTLLLNKGQSAAVSTESAGRNHESAPTGQFFDKTCFYCRKPGHGANRWPDNPNRGKRCANCG